MKKQFQITIPKPCHENWNTMTPKEKGRFCDSCAKVVVDFTKKSTKEIQDYLVDNYQQKTCGHFYKKQLDSITIEIPQVSFTQQVSFQKLFILALFFVMGTTLFSCKYSDGKTQKIENIVIVDTLQKIEKRVSIKDSINNKTKPGIEIIEIITTGDLEVLETEGEIVLEEIEEEEEIVEDVIIGMVVQEFPRFPESKNLSEEASKKYFNKKITQHLLAKLNNGIKQCLDLNVGKYKIDCHFTINELGNVTDIKIKAPHPLIKRKITETLIQLPKFIPGKQGIKPIKTNYRLPITFVVE